MKIRGGIYQFLVICFFCKSLAFGNSQISNTLIYDNPETPVSTIKANSKDRPAELNINIKKFSSLKIDGILNRNKDLINFILPDLIKENEDIFVTDNLNIFTMNNNIKIIKNIQFKVFKENKFVEVNYKTAPKNIYIVKYSKENRNLVALYRWNNKEYVEEERFNSINIFLKDGYIPYEEILITKNIDNTKINIIGGSINQLPKNTTEVDIYSLSGEFIKKINIISGNGNFGLENDYDGIILKNGGMNLKTGLGFENGYLKLKIKEWNDAITSYGFILKIKTPQKIIQQKMSITPSKHKLKILTGNIDLKFGNLIEKALENRSGKAIPQILDEIFVQIPNNTIKVDVAFKNNGFLTIVDSESKDTIKTKLEAHIPKTRSLEKTKLGTKPLKIVITGQIEEDIINKNNGVYTGNTELIINIDT